MLLSFLMLVGGIVYLAYGYWQISRQKLPAKLRLSWGAAMEIATASDATATVTTDTSATAEQKAADQPATTTKKDN